MPRAMRLDLAGVTQHVVQRGNDRQACFFQPVDYVRYPQDLREAALKFECRVHAYVLMTNHVHLLVTPPAAGAVSRMTQAVGRRYVRYINDSICRTGTLWECRYKSGLVDSERYVMACYRYIELNPVRAGMVVGPADYRWSSHRCNGLGQHDPVVSAHPLYQQLATDALERCAMYRELVSQALSADDMAAIRQYVQRQRALGSSKFQAQIEQQLQRRAGLGRPERPPKEKGTLTPVLTYWGWFSVAGWYCRWRRSWRCQPAIGPSGNSYGDLWSRRVWRVNFVDGPSVDVYWRRGASSSMA